MLTSDVEVNTFLSGACGPHPHPHQPTFQLAWNVNNASAAAAAQPDTDQMDVGTCERFFQTFPDSCEGASEDVCCSASRYSG